MEKSAPAPQPSPRVAALVYHIERGSVRVAIVENGNWAWNYLFDLTDLLGRILSLREELDKIGFVSACNLPRLQEFYQGWGRAFIPEPVRNEPPDVLIFVPQGELHGLPLHLVAASDDYPMALRSGTTYCSSISLLIRCLSARLVDDTPASVVAARGGGANIAHSIEDDKFRELAVDLLGQLGAPRETFRCFDRLTALKILADESVDLACIVCHGFIDPQTHLDSGLFLDRVFDDNFILQPGRTETFYGNAYQLPDVAMRYFPSEFSPARPSEVLTIRELEIRGTVRSNLILLLACFAGASRVMRGDQPASIADTLLRLGGGSVISPMWSCDRELARDWATCFLECWSKGMPKALAVRDAFRALPYTDNIAELGPLHMRGNWR